jgi:hypothetical protein
MIHPTKGDGNFMNQGKYPLLSGGIPSHSRKYLKELTYEEAKQQNAV